MSVLAGGALWALFAGTVVATFLAALVALIVRGQRPAASTRCALWFVALVMFLVAPLTIGVGMTARSGSRAVLAQDRVARLVRPSIVRIEGALHGNRASDAWSHPRLRALEAAFVAVLRPPELSVTAARALFAISLGGGLLGFVELGLGLVRVHRLKARSTPLDGALASELTWLTDSGGREIYLRLSYEIETPIAIGFGRPVILIPTDMATADGLAAIEPLVIHEYAHLARYDDWTNLTQRAIERLLWFNPLVWYVGRRLALEREVTADDAVVARTNDARGYASTLWRMVREMRMPERVVVAPGAMLSRKQISVRIERLLDEARLRRPYFGSIVLVVAVAAFMAGAVAATAPPLDSVMRAAQLDPTARRADADAAVAPVAAMIAATVVPALKALAPVIGSRSPASDGTGHHSRSAGGCTGCNFEDADLRGEDLHDAKFEGADMQEADLRGANLRGAELTGVNLSGANLDGADLRDARVIGTDLSDASMNGTLTRGATFVGSTLP